MSRKLLAVAAWACLLFIVYATLTASGSRPRSTSGEPEFVVLVERFGAYALLGGLFGLAYPRHPIAVCLVVFGAAILLEGFQLLIPDRDARLIDGIEKLAGGATGIATARALARFSGWRVWGCRISGCRAPIKTSPAREENDGRQRENAR